MKTHTPNIRLAMPDDIPQVVDLRVAMQLEISEQPLPNSLSEYKELVRQFLADNLGNGSFVCPVAEHEGKLVAMGAVSIYKKIPPLGAATGKVGYVTSVYTLPECRRRGIAGKLMTFLIEQCRLLGIEKLHLGATEAGKGVYERAGFHAPKFVPLEIRCQKQSSALLLE